MILFTITNTFAAELFATKLKCRGSWKNWRPGISYSNPIPDLISVCEIANLGMGREWENPFPQFGNGKGMKKSIPKIRERKGNEKVHSQNSGKGIRGFHSWERTGTGIPAHPWSFDLLNSMIHCFRWSVDFQICKRWIFENLCYTHLRWSCLHCIHMS